MADEEGSENASPPESPKAPALSELQQTIGGHSKYIADHFDKLYEEVDQLKVNNLIVFTSSRPLLSYLSSFLSLSLLQKHFRIWRKNLCPGISKIVVLLATNIPISIISSSPFNESGTVATISSGYHCEMVLSRIDFLRFFLSKLDSLPTHNVQMSFKTFTKVTI